MLNVILRPAWNRPEMLKLSILYEEIARLNYNFSSKLYTIFVLDHNANPDVLKVISKYSFDFEVIQRPFRYGLTPNILEGYKVAFNKSDNYVITIEDDILLHKDYFRYIDTIFNLKENLPKYSVINATGPNNGDVEYIKKAHHYGPWAPLVDKDFFIRYILPHANSGYYNNRPAKMAELNKNYLKYFPTHQYKFNNLNFNEQAGLINRLVDHAMIDEDIYVLTPEINRERNIGYFGKNRPGGVIPGSNFEEKTKNLIEIIKDPKIMVKYAGSGQWEKDYALFNDSLEVWNGKIKVRD